ncbi:MAG: hypothetical protein F6K26_56675, partial [Moorea sp. SIO2I5]|nr:hypothetical protein [Moorena sp. SIO2I5]
LFDPVGVTGIRRGTGFQPVAIFGRAIPTLAVRYGTGYPNTTRGNMSAIASYHAPYATGGALVKHLRLSPNYRSFRV